MAAVTIKLKTLTCIEQIIANALSNYKEETDFKLVTDIQLLVLPETGELIVFDDDDVKLADGVVEEWTTLNTDFSTVVRSQLTVALTQMKENGQFKDIHLFKPYSFILIDEDHEALDDLLLVDDDTVVLNEELLEGLDEELNAFLAHLLSD
ncbi:MAG: hypothetical protein WCQ82_03950 [Bacteroidaceae bacterium]|nr:hypothetical protein [Bacteroidaceae bacterium]